MPHESTTPETTITPEITITGESKKRLPDAPPPQPTPQLPVAHPPTLQRAASHSSAPYLVTPHSGVSYSLPSHLSAQLPQMSHQTASQLPRLERSPSRHSPPRLPTLERTASHYSPPHLSTPPQASRHSPPHLSAQQPSQYSPLYSPSYSLPPSRAHPPDRHLPIPHPPTSDQPTHHAPQLTMPQVSQSPNSLELHIPIPLPTPPTPLPRVVAYPLFQGLVTPALEYSPEDPEKYHRSRCDTMQTDDSGIELDPVPKPVYSQGMGSSGISVDCEPVILVAPEKKDKVDLERTTALEEEFELLDMTDEERLDAQTVHLFRSLNVPVNIHRLRAMRAKGRIPEPLLKFRHGSAYPKASKIPSPPGKENKDVHLTSILRESDSTSLLNTKEDPISPTDKGTVQGESWYLPSATARRRVTRRASHDFSEPRETAGRWESPPIKEPYHDIPAPKPVIPNYDILDQFPLPPSSVPSVSDHGEQYPLPASPAPSLAQSRSGRPLGYMYGPARTPHRNPSYRSLNNSPANSFGSSRTLTSGPSPVGAYYAYDLLTSAPGALPYSIGSSPKVSPKSSHPPSAWTYSLLQR